MNDIYFDLEDGIYRTYPDGDKATGYDIKYQVENLQKENKRLKNIETSLIFIKNRVKQGMTQENINKCAIDFVNSYLKDSDIK